MKIFTLSIAFCTIFSLCNSQSILNGSFETNNASGDVLDMFPNTHAAMLPNSAAVDGGYMDLITTGTYCGTAQQGNWFVQNNISEFYGSFSLEFSGPLVQGNNYVLTFYVRACSSAGSFNVGLAWYDSTLATTNIHAGNSGSTNWTLTTVNFTAPDSARNLIIDIPNGGMNNRMQFDNFVLSVPSDISNATEPASSVCHFPNPSGSWVNFSFGENCEGSELRISDPEGKIFYSHPVRENSLAADLTGLPAGIYIYSVYKNQTVLATGKLVRR